MAVDTSPIQFSHQIEPGTDTHAHGLNHESFLSLSNQGSLQTLIESGKAVQISITPEIEQLAQLQAQGHDGYLNVTLPMVGVTDYLSSENGNSAAHAFGSVLGLNQFSADNQQPNFSRPDFIVAKDIVGNQYEILVEPSGKVAVPEEGAGKFSILSEIKLMYGLDQVLEGRGLSEGGQQQSGCLYILPPPGFHGKYSPVLSVSQTQDDFSEKEIMARKTPILLQEVNNEAGACKAVINTHDLGVQHSADKLAELGWQPVDNAGKFEKHFGLSEAGLQSVSKYLFNEYDFTKAILSGDEFGVKHISGLNDFALSPEAIGVYYDLWLSSVVNHQISPDNLLSRINLQELLNIEDLSVLGLSPAEQLSMQAVLTQAKLGDFSGLQHLYEPHFTQVENLKSHVAAELGVDSLDNHAIVIDSGMHHNPSDHLLDYAPIHDNLLENDYSIHASGKTIVLNMSEVFSPEGGQGVVIAGFNVNHDKLDLSSLLNQLPGVHIQDFSADLHGQDIKINYADPHTGQVQTLAILVSAAPDNCLPDLLHYLHLNQE